MTTSFSTSSARRVRRHVSALASAVSATFFCLATAAAAPTRESNDQVFSLQMPRDVSLHGEHMDHLALSGLAMISVLFLIMCVWMFYAVVVHNKDHKAHYTHGDSKRAVMGATALALSVFLICDGNLWFNSTYDMHNLYWNFDAVDDDPRVLRIELNAHQWAWDARYAGPDGEFNNADDVVSTNEIVVPTGRPVLFQIAATDVIHSLYLPQLRVKQDAMPGMLTRAWFVAKEKGDFEIACAQHCGVHHYKMRGIIRIVDPADYEAWANEMSKNHKIGWNPADKEGHWGWEWKKGG